MKRSETQRLGIRNVKTLQSISARSIPRAQRSSYLELYLMIEKKRRLEKEISILNVRETIARKQLTSINKRIDILQSEGIAEQKGMPPSSLRPTRQMKKMSINYG